MVDRIRLRNKRRRLWEREGRQCFWCDKPLTFEETTNDHLICRSTGGDNHDLNVVCSCNPCNNKRGDTEYMAWAMACWADKKEPAG